MGRMWPIRHRVATTGSQSEGSVLDGLPSCSLTSGLTVWTVPKPRTPRAHLQLSCRTPPSEEPGERKFFSEAAQKNNHSLNFPSPQNQYGFFDLVTHCLVWKKLAQFFCSHYYVKLLESAQFSKKAKQISRGPISRARGRRVGGKEWGRGGGPSLSLSSFFIRSTASVEDGDAKEE